ncbi:MAG: hypothetical protein KFB97_09515 [Cyanobium sp. M30B3]|jgi:hypothetical protein|nr:MAG: hypothetical protein KFB97_09515 [Cyanobium sp. M30B3]
MEPTGLQLGQARLAIELAIELLLLHQHAGVEDPPPTPPPGPSGFS